MGTPASLVRYRPIRSKFSSEKPIGSMILWQDAQVGFLRCCSIRCRTDAACGAEPSVSSGGMFGGGVGAGVPSRFSKTHLPRATGDVRFATEVTSRKLD